MIGSIVGCRTVIGESILKNYERYWLCQCICGEVSYVKESRLKDGSSKSCGCKGTRTSLEDWSDSEKWHDFLKDFVAKQEAKDADNPYYGRYYCPRCDNEELFLVSGGCYGCEKRKQAGVLSNTLRSRLSNMFKKIGRRRPRNKFSNLMGCDTQTLGEWVESLFHDHPITGTVMCYENRGMYGVPERWQLDHVVPLKDFDLTDNKQVKEACHYTNIMPTWSVVHIQKTNLENQGFEESLEEIWKRINE